MKIHPISQLLQSTHYPGKTATVLKTKHKQTEQNYETMSHACLYQFLKLAEKY